MISKLGRGFGWLFLLNDWLVVFGSIFGGCCSNAWSLESLMRRSPDCGGLECLVDGT